MKMYKKSDLTYVNGYLVTEDNEIVMPARCVVEQANRLETMWQKCQWLEEHPQPEPAPSTKEFKRKSERDSLPRFEAETPLLDFEVAKSMALVRELDHLDDAREANETIREMRDLVEFIESDRIVCFSDLDNRFDLPTLGDPLKWDQTLPAEVIAKALGYDDEEEEEEDLDDFLMRKLNACEFIQNLESDKLVPNPEYDPGCEFEEDKDVESE